MDYDELKSHIKQSKLNKIFVYIMNLASFLIGDLLFGWTSTLQTNTIQIDSQDFYLPDIDHLKAIQISDIHWDFPTQIKRISHNLMQKTINICNKENPDIIFITGDFVQRYAIPVKELCENYLSKLKSKYGVWCVLGNHDYKEGKKGAEHVINTLRSYGLHVLDNENAYPINGNKNFEIVGLGDLKSGDFIPEKAFQHSSEDCKFRIVLSHNPDSAALLRKYKVNLQLSGHTHGGQICLPFIGPIIPLYYKMMRFIIPRSFFRLVPFKKFYSVVKKWEWCEGFHKISRIDKENEFNYLYVNKGLASHPPARLFCPPEITIFILKNKSL